MEVKTLHQTRESWLLAATESLRSSLFLEQGAKVPVLRVSVGFPGGRSASKAIGQYWNGLACVDATPAVFISPVIHDPIRALDVLVHELVHSVHPTDGHGKAFGKLARAVGLEGKLTATVAGEALKARLNALASSLGSYPHAALNLSEKKKQTTRLNKATCPDCGYTCRVTRKWLESSGAPICPCNSQVMAIQ